MMFKGWVAIKGSVASGECPARKSSRITLAAVTVHMTDKPQVQALQGHSFLLGVVWDLSTDWA